MPNKTTTIELVEHETSRAVRLSIPERDALARTYPNIRIQPSPGKAGCYDVTPDQKIGVLRVGQLEIRIRPKIAMHQVLFLVSYGCGLVHWRDQRASYDDAVEFTPMMAHLLSKAIQHATANGLLCGYQRIEESRRRPRGRILFSRHLQMHLGQSPPIRVQHDVYTADTVENQILLAALARLASLVTLEAPVQNEVRRAMRPFGGVRLVRFPPQNVPRISFTRLNEHYRGAINLATLLLSAGSVDLRAGAFVGDAFLVDMNKVFERFVRQALREALGLDRRAFPDPPFGTVSLDVADRIGLAPDLIWLGPRGIGAPRWVGDAKYKRLSPAGYKNADVYQALAYATALQLDGAYLIYAHHEGVKEATHTIRNAGKRIRVASLDLTAPPHAILDQVRALATDIHSSAARTNFSPRATAARAHGRV